MGRDWRSDVVISRLYIGVGRSVDISRLDIRIEKSVGEPRDHCRRPAFVLLT